MMIKSFKQVLDEKWVLYAFVDKYIESFTKKFPPSEIL
jgi:hypothetical protein